MATTEQLMGQYGVAWFGFDEASGNVLDKLGNGYTGIVTGVTRVGGWNGEGNAMNFNGTSQYIQTNLRHSTNETTVKFKVRPNSSTSSLVFSSQGWSTATQGIDIMIRGTEDAVNNGKVMLRIGKNTQAISLFSEKKLEINKWHEVIVSFDGKTDGYSKIYINGELTGTVRNTFSLDTVTNVLFIGKNSSTNAHYFKGQLDDFQIYNKVLSPPDFTQKRLVVKTTDNKNLVLSPTSTRVKEIPNTAEYMMLAQGGVVREIDSAVDSQPIDFTKTTTEYEIVSNDKTPLGKNRMITIPIGSDFKTAMIEDNY